MLFDSTLLFEIYFFMKYSLVLLSDFWEQSIHYLTFQKFCLEDSVCPSYSLLIQGIVQMGFQENQGIYRKPLSDNILLCKVKLSGSTPHSGIV